MSDPVSPLNADASTTWARDAAIAAGVTAFLLIFRPFGLALDNLAEWLVVIGVAPLNFLLMQIVHRLPSLQRGRRRVLAIMIFAVCNTLWLSQWSGPSLAEGISLLIKVSAVTALTVLALSLWLRERSARRTARSALQGDQTRLTLKGAGDHEILRLKPEELLYLHAQGNYVEAAYLRKGQPTTSLLRSSLRGMSRQIPPGLLLSCHRSWLVNRALVQRVVRRDHGLELELDHARFVPVSRSHRDAVLAAMRQPAASQKGDEGG